MGRCHGGEVRVDGVECRPKERGQDARMKETCFIQTLQLKAALCYAQRQDERDFGSFLEGDKAASSADRGKL